MKQKLAFFSILLLLGVSVILYSCSDTNKDTTSDNKSTTTEETTTAEGVNESPEDLTTVDYKVFYDKLSAKGEWVQVKADDIGVDISDASFDKKGSSFLAELIGVKAAYAQDENNFDADMIFVWRPLDAMAVRLNTDLDGNQDGIFDRTGVDADLLRTTPAYVPYADGRWLYTDNAGWYYMANTPEEEITTHYGRWAWDPDMGYVWVPGRVWAPSWVDWRVNDNYVAWAPIPPSVWVENNTIDIDDNDIDYNRYVFVEKRYFVEPEMTKYMYQYHDNGEVIKIKEMRRVNGVMVKNQTMIINQGPDKSEIEKVAGKTIEVYTVNTAAGDPRSSLSNKTITVNQPKFERYSKSNGKSAGVTKRSKPNKFNSSEEVKTKVKSKGQENKEMKKDEKQIDKDNKGKGNDDGNLKGPVNDDKKMNKGNDNKGDDKQYNKSNDNKVNDSKNDDKGNSKSNDKGNDKGNKGKR